MNRPILTQSRQLAPGEEWEGDCGHEWLQALCSARVRRRAVDEAELERVIAELLRRKYAAPEASAERRMAQRQLLGLRYSYELAGPIMEDLDPLEWGAIAVAPRSQ